MADVDEGKLLALVDAIYESVLDETRWPATLREIAWAFNGSGAMFRCIDVETRKLVFFDGLGYDPALLAVYPTRFSMVDPYAKLNASRLLGIVADTRLLIDAARHERSEYRHEWELPQDKFRMMGGMPDLHGVYAVQVGVHRGRGAGEFDGRDFALMRRLFPHYARAARMRHRLIEVDALREVAAFGLDQFAMAAIFVAEDGAIVYRNAAAEPLFQRGILRTEGGVLGLPGDVNDRGLRQLIHTATTRDRHGCGGTLCLRDAEGRAEHQLWIIPLPQRAPAERWGVSTAARVLVLVASKTTPPPAPVRLAAAYGLTPAEARLAASLVDGDELVTVAGKLGISINTAKTQLKSVFAKTGTRRQSELVALLLRATAATCCQGEMN